MKIVIWYSISLYLTLINLGIKSRFSDLDLVTTRMFSLCDKGLGNLRIPGFTFFIIAENWTWFVRKNKDMKILLEVINLLIYCKLLDWKLETDVTKEKYYEMLVRLFIHIYHHLCDQAQSVCFDWLTKKVSEGIIERYINLTKYTGYMQAIYAGYITFSIFQTYPRLKARLHGRFFSFWRMRLSGWVTKVLIYIALHRWSNTFVSQSI